MSGFLRLVAGLLSSVVASMAFIAALVGIDSLAPAQTSPRPVQPWVAMDRGPYFTASIESSVPERQMTPKGIAIRVSAVGNAYVLFDTDLLRYSAGWTGGSIDFHGVVFDGEHRVWPKAVGEELFGTRMIPGWAGHGGFDDPRQKYPSTDYQPQPQSWRNRGYGPLPHDWAQYKGLYLHGQQTILSYTVSGTAVLDSPAWDEAAGGVFLRTLNIEESATDLTLNVLDAASQEGGIAPFSDPAALSKRAPARDAIVILGKLNATRENLNIRPKPPAEGLVASWTFDADAATTSGPYASTLNGAKRAPGPFTGAISCADGSHVLVTHSDDLDMDGDFSISAWIKTAHGGTIFSKTVAGKWMPGGKTLFVENGTLMFDCGWVGAARGSKMVNNDRWRHVAVTHSAATGATQLYVDGAADASAQLKLKPNPKGSQARFGITSDNFPRGDGNRLDGSLADLLFYRRALSPQEIAALAGGVKQELPPVLAAVSGATEGMSWEFDASSRLLLHIPAASTPARLTIRIGKPNATDTGAFIAAAKAAAAPADLSQFTHGGPPRWPPTITTTGSLGGDNLAYTVDTISLPDNNPWNARMRPGGFDFFKDGRRAAVCTWDGDVWIVDGIDAALAQLTWKRIATGMFQPLGLKIVPDESGHELIYVCCRDQITRLRDLNGDGETDFYECFNNDHQVTEHFHEFAMGLQTDPEGNFYYAKSARHALDAVVPQHGTLLKVSRDGSKTAIICNGFRAANGFGLSPTGEMAATDQEGYWTPANRINLVKPGGFYGNMWSYLTTKRTPADGYDPPMCWLPVNVDRSPAEDLWVTSDKWGPLKGKLVHTSYGTGNFFLAMYEYIDGVPQGGVVPFPGIKFPTGVMRGRFNPMDGQLYVCGLVGWSSNTAAPGGFYRIRYTGKPANLPAGIEVKHDAIVLSFTDPLDREAAADRDNYAVQQWQYRWTSNYGSKHYSIADPNKQAQDEVEVKSAALSADGRQVTLTIPGLKPVMQMQIDMQIKSAGGAALHYVIHNTINKVPK